jgi:hypothetical protein
VVEIRKHHGGDKPNDTRHQRRIREARYELLTDKLLIQVQDVVIETPVDLVERLKISDGKTHPIGAHEKEKKTS